MNFERQNTILPFLFFVRLSANQLPAPLAE